MYIELPLKICINTRTELAQVKVYLTISRGLTRLIVLHLESEQGLGVEIMGRGGGHSQYDSLKGKARTGPALL